MHHIEMSCMNFVNHSGILLIMTLTGVKGGTQVILVMISLFCLFCNNIGHPLQVLSCDVAPFKVLC